MSKYPTKSSDADRRIRQADRLSRVLRVLQLLQSRGRWDAKAIASELEISERTVYRDLAVLELAGVPWTFDREAECYRLRPDFRFPVLGLSDEEVLGQATATAVTQAPGLNIDLGSKPTTQKLAATQQQAARILSEAGELVQVLDLKLADHSLHRESIRTIQWALIERKQLTGQYVSPYEPQPVKLVLHPYRLCLVKYAWYVVGRPTDRAEPITLRVTRFKSLRMLDNSAEIPDGFDLGAYFGNAWAVYRGQPTYDVELLFSKEATDIVSETTWHHTQQAKRHKDGSLTLTFRVDGLNEIVRWVLGWAGKVKVVRPVELRSLVIDQHRKAIDANE